MNVDITIIVNSCDSYSDLWDPFFTLFHKHWPKCPYKIILNTEQADYRFEGLDIDVVNQATENVGYGKRLKEVLNKVQSNYVLLLLDDFFIREAIDATTIQRCKQWMDDDHEIALMSFESVDDPLNTHDKSHPGFVLRPRYAEYKINLQAGLWRKTDLMQLLRDDETPWDFELLGNIRTFASSKKFYALNINSPRIINYRKNDGRFPYKWSVVSGKWVVDTVDSLFKENGIQVDYNTRGIYTDEDFRRDANIKMDYSTSKLKKSIGYITYIKIYKWGYVKKFMSLFRVQLPAQYIDFKRKKLIK